MIDGMWTEFGIVKRIVRHATLLYEGWEMDNDAWLVEMEDGRTLLFGTNHGKECMLSAAELKTCLKAAEESAESIRRLLAMCPPDPLPEGALEVPDPIVARDVGGRFLKSRHAYRASAEPTLYFPSVLKPRGKA